MVIKAVTGGYAGGGELWFMSPEGTVQSAQIGENIEWPYFYSDTELTGSGVVETELESIRVLRLNEIAERKMWKISMDSPQLTKGLRGKAEFTAEDDIVYLDRRLGADGEVEWVPPKRISFMDLESDRKTGKPVLFGSLVGDKYEPFKSAADYFRAMEDDKIAMATAWNGDKYDFRLLDNEGGSEHWNRMAHTDCMDLWAKFGPRHTRRGLDVVARREKVGEKLDPEKVGLEAYNENDCRIMKKIVEKGDLIGTEYALGHLTGIMPTPMNLRAIALFENYLMRNRAKYNLWLEGGRGFRAKEPRIQGAMILYGDPGIYDGADVLDYTSLYPSVVMYESYHGNGETVWRVTQQLAREWVSLKEACTGKPDKKTLREAYKVLANGSGYGIFMSSGFRYGVRDIAAFITATARSKLMELRGITEKMGFVPLMSDTDSCVVQIPKEKAAALLKTVNKRVAPYSVKEEYYLRRFILFGGLKGKAVKKRYAGLTEDDTLVVKGLEMVRNDWSPWAREMQERLLMVMLKATRDTVAQALNEAVAAEKESFFSGKVPVDDVAITKSIDTEKVYKVKTQHVKAYEQMEDKGEGVIGFVSYWVDAKGKTIVRNEETDEEIRAKLDWKAIWKKQAEPIITRLKSCFQTPVRTLEVYLTEEGEP